MDNKISIIANILLALGCIQLAAMSYKSHQEAEAYKEKLQECQEQSVLDKLKEKFPRK